MSLKLTTNCMTIVMEYLEHGEQLESQKVSKKFYNKIVPLAMHREKKFPKIARHQLLLNFIDDLSKDRADILVQSLIKDITQEFSQTQWPHTSR